MTNKAQAVVAEHLVQVQMTRQYQILIRRLAKKLAKVDDILQSRWLSALKLDKRK